MNTLKNIDIKTVEGFGDEWVRFDQSELPVAELQSIFDSYFSIFPWSVLPKDAIGFDLGCGSGRWARLSSPRVRQLHCIDPSIALDIARKNLAENKNCIFHSATVDAIPLENESMDFGYSLGVLHHVPDTEAGIKACVLKLKKGAPFLLYLYYAFDNRPWWFQLVWRLSDMIRFLVCRMPYGLRYFISQIFAFFVYLPLAKMALYAKKMGINVKNFPLTDYRNRSFYTMRTDALDRFGTRLEQRFTKNQIKEMMERSGLERIEFSKNMPYWCAVGYRSNGVIH